MSDRRRGFTRRPPWGGFAIREQRRSALRCLVHLARIENGLGTRSRGDIDLSLPMTDAMLTELVRPFSDATVQEFLYAESTA